MSPDADFAGPCKNPNKRFFSKRGHRVPRRDKQEDEKSPNKENEMTKHSFVKACVALAAAMAVAPAVNAAPEKVDTKMCTACHSNIGGFHKSGAHKDVSCTSCHTGLTKHMSAPGKDTRPTTSMDPKTCGSCHPAQFNSMHQVNDHRIPRQSKKAANGVAPDPFFDRALGAHGFTKEHDEPRSHTFAALDQFLIDRGFGGRFEPKDGWMYMGMGDGAFRVWDVIKDNYPEDNVHKPRRPGTAAAVNSVCWTCKSTDLMLDWAYMGDKVEGAKWSRQSNPVDLMRNVNHALNCNFCHDPHSTQPRVVRDGLIQALTRTDFPTVYSQDPKATKINVIDMGVRGFTRKIATMEKADSKLMCAQCHVEYNCNPGFDPKTGKAIGMDDQRTNLFPFVDVTKIDEFYAHAGFKDFKHPATGAALTKMQHPDVETYWNSTHDKAGVQCADCHMPKVKDKKTGKVYTSHWSTSPRNYMKETCMQCHKDKTEKQLNKVIDGMKAYYMGKLREAESRMTDMFNAFDLAIAMGVSDEVLNKARELHSVAHTNWEWWTAVNGAYFHNPEAARLSLAKSADAAQKATKILRDAMTAKNKK